MSKRVLLRIRLQELRERIGMTRREVSGITGIGQKTLDDYESCKHHPDLESLVLLARCLKQPVDDFIEVVSIDPRMAEKAKGPIGQRQYAEVDKVLVERNA